MAGASEHSRSQSGLLPPRRALARLLMLATWLVFAAAPGRAAAGPEVWQDPASGLAIGGFDPVAYFTRGGPRRGDSGLELKWGGAVWRFLNIGNRAAFELHPRVYAPRFAGYDAAALADGRTTQGDPSIWAIYGNRLYLFHDSVNRRLWETDRDRVIAEAEMRWPALAATLPTTLGE